jgi:penicillin-binding protein 1A
MDDLGEPELKPVWEEDPRQYMGEGAGAHPDDHDDDMFDDVFADGDPLFQHPPRRRGWLGRILLGLMIAAGALIILVAWLSWSLPVSRALEPLPHPALVLVSADGKAIARRGPYKEAPVNVEALPAYVPAAFVSIEDRRFYHHFGIDLIGIGRAAVTNIKLGHVRQGGSTITQQLAKTAFLSNDRTFRRKFQEVFIALWLEARLSKNEILSRYLSSVYFGDGVFGLRAASQHYFGKPPESLSLGEAATLAGLVKAPSALNPVDHPQAAAQRARIVVGAMIDTKAITPETARAIRRIRIAPQSQLPVGGYFADWAAPQVKQAMEAQYGEVRVRTTLDSRLQRLAERAVRGELAASGGRLNASQAALVAMRRDGSVVAMVGGRDYGASQFNRAVQAKRQPGSAFKLFVYLAAIRDGWSPDNMVSNEPITVGGWTPKNFERNSGGELTLRDAFAQSSNIAAVHLAQRVGRDRIVQTARDLGVTSPLVNDATLPLGTSEMTLLELTSAYAAVSAGRAPLTPFALRDPDTPQAPTAQLNPRDRAALLELLSAAATEGTGRAAYVGQPTFGKTGTAQDHRDAVFVGFTGDIVVGVWVGNDDHSPMKGVTGGGLPAQIWRDFTGSALNAGLVERVRPPPPPPKPADDDDIFHSRSLGDVVKHIFGGLFSH